MNRMNGTKFILQEELKDKLTEIDLEKEGYISGGVPLVVQGGKAYVDASDSHTIIFGATGSKKTRLLGMPTVEILSGAGESFIITDPKGEIYDKTVQNVRQRGYQVFCINLREFKKGSTWNPLSLPFDLYRNDERSKAVEMVSELAGMIIGNDLDDPFWSNAATDVLTGFMLILLDKASREECNIKSMIALWMKYLDSREETRKLINKAFSGSLIRRKLGTLYSSSEKTVGSIESVVSTGINRLAANEEFVELLSQDGLEFGAVTNEKTAIYIIVPDENTFTHFAASIFLGQLYEVLIKEAQRQPEHKLAARMNFIVDEFANIPKINNMQSMITASRSRNIRFCLIIQSKMQLVDKYQDAASVICDNCSNWIYLYSKDYELLSEISKLCGNVIYDNHLVMPLISEFELQHLNKEEGEALVLSGRNYPCIVNLADIDEYPSQKKRRLQRAADGGNDAQMYMEAVPWQQVCIFSMDEEHIMKENADERAYMFPLQRLRDQKDQKNKDKWLVGTYNGMILVDELVTEKELKSGEGILRASLCHFEELEDAMELEWHVASRQVQSSYALMLHVASKDKVFVTLQELGIHNFKPVKMTVPQCLMGKEE